jgi:tetratricopeptide (TPR) repeat protein
MKTGLIAFVSSIAGFLIIPIAQINAAENVSWLLFEDKNGFFTLKYPSNWGPYKYIEDSSAPINIYFAYARSDSSFAELVLSGEKSIHTNVTNLVDTYPVYLQSYPDYKVIQETQCGKYTIDNISACHLIITYRNADLDGQPTVYELVVATLDDKGMEYILVYYVTKDLYDHFLPVAKHMISSFDVTDNTTNIDEEITEKGINKTNDNENRNNNQSLSTVPNNQTVLNYTNKGNESLSTVPNNQTVLNYTNKGNESLSTVPNNQTVLNYTNKGNESLSNDNQINDFIASQEFYDATDKAKSILSYILNSIFPHTGEKFTNNDYGVDMVFPKNWTGIEMRIVFPMAVVSPEGFNITDLFSTYIDSSLDNIAESIVAINETELPEQEFQELIEPRVQESAELLSQNILEYMENKTTTMSIFIYDKELVGFLNSVNPDSTESVGSLASLYENLVDASKSTISCDRITSNQTILNSNISAEVLTEKCLLTDRNKYRDNLNYLVLTPRALVGIQYTSDSNNENDRYLVEFEESLKTLSVKESLPINNQTIEQFVSVEQPASQSMNTSSVSRLVERGNSFYDLKMYEEAISWYDKALVVDPNDIDASYYKGTAYDELHRYEDALTWFEKTLKIDPRHVNATIYKAVALEELGKKEEAVNWYDKALEIDPKNLIALYNKGVPLYDLGRYEEVIIWSDKVLKIDPKKINALYNKALALAALDRHEEAILWFDKALEVDSKFVIALNGKGVSFDILGKHEEAITWFDMALKIDPEFIHALNNKGLALNGLEKHDEAIAFYDKALEIDPKDVRALTNKGAVLSKLGKHEEAITWFDKALDIDPENFKTLYNKAILHSNLDRHEEAITWYDKALAIDPKSVDALFGKGTSLYDLGKYEEAITWYDKALAIDPKSVDALFGKGTSLYDLGKYEEAITWFDKALAIDARYIDALINKGGAFYRLGMKDDAVTWLDKAFDIDAEWLDNALEKDPKNKELLELESLIRE